MEVRFSDGVGMRVEARGVGRHVRPRRREDAEGDVKKARE